jgi:hypothetical protein
VAKTLVSTNPNLLSEHQRLGCIKPLVMLCRESASTELQQFEALLALTNILSCGSTEHDKFVAEKGVGAVHYLIFSENWMVRRAAVEALCNMATNEHVLKVSYNRCALINFVGYDSTTLFIARMPHLFSCILHTYSCSARGTR